MGINRVLSRITAILTLLLIMTLTLPFTSNEVLAASIDISTTSGPPGTSVTIHGYDFEASEEIYVTFDDTSVASTTASSSGNWSTTFTVPQSTGGVHDINAYGPTSGIFTDSFTVTGAISLSKSSGAPGTSVTVSGIGFANKETSIKVTYDGSSIVTGLTASATGTWSTTITIPASSGGSHVIGASGASTSSVSTQTFTTTATISLGSNSGVPGNAVTIAGLGFAANETGIYITFDGTSIMTGITSDSSGAWVSSFTIPSSSSGTHTVGAAGTVSTSVSTKAFIIRSGISLSQSSGSPGTSITVNGSGFSANENNIVVTFGNEQVATGISAGSNGTWSTNFTIPQCPAGLYLISAHGAVTTAASITGASFTSKAAVTLGRSSASPGNTITVNGVGFAASETGINVAFDGTQVASNITAQANGSWTANFVVPASSSGSHNITAAGSITTATSVSGASFTSGAAITLNKTSGSPGNSITVTGAGFGANETGITITFDNNPVVSNLVANSAGSWSTTLNIPAATYGSHVISANGSLTVSTAASQTNFNITPSIILSPTTGYVGSTVRISGTGFAANSQIRITYDDVEITERTPISDATGSVSVSITIPVSKSGTNPIAVTDSQGNNIKSSFTISSTPPAVPEGISPKDNSTLSITGGIKPNFKWTNVTNPNGVTFRLQISADTDFSDIILDKTNIPANHYTLQSSESLPRGRYYWRVKAIDAASNESDWSSTWTLKSGLMPAWLLVFIIILAVAGSGVGAYFGIIRRIIRKREAITVSEVEMPTFISTPLPALESEETIRERQTYKRLALPEVSKSAKTLPMEDQARLKVILDFAQSIPLPEPDYTMKWLIALLESQLQTEISMPVYEQLLKGDIQIHYEPNWTRHPIYKDLTSMLQKQPILQKLNAFIENVDGCASDAAYLIHQIYRESVTEIPKDLLQRGGWGFVTAVYIDAINWYAGKSLHDPSERDYSLETPGDTDNDPVKRWLCGEVSTLFAGHLILAQDEQEALQLRSVHLKMRRTWRNSERCRQISNTIMQLQLQRSELLSTFSQFGRTK